MSCRVTTDVAQAADLLRCGKLVAFPTETVYGLGADATNAHAVARVFAAKNRPRFDPLIVHVAETTAADSVVKEWSPLARELANRFWPGPLTLVLPKRTIIPDIVTAGLDTVAVRVPAHPIAAELLRQADRPIAAPSANPFGRISPTTAEHVARHLGEEIDLILEGGPSDVGVESTVVQVGADGVRLLRPGGTSAEAIEEIVGDLVTADDVESGPLQSPGLTKSHYAPKTRLVLCPDRIPDNARRIGRLSFMGEPASYPVRVEEVLSATGDLAEAAANLFSALRRLDDENVDIIVADTIPNRELGRAINDRLQRASVRS